MQCSRCSAPASIGSLCERHWLARQELFRIKPFSLVQCRRCKAVAIGRGWHQINIENLDRVVKEKIKTFHKLSSLQISTKRTGNVFKLHITAQGRIPPAKAEKTEHKELHVRLKTLMCPMCTKLVGGYHEAVLQLRGQRADAALRAIATRAPARIVHTAHGPNVYFVHKADAAAAAATLKRRGFMLTRSFKFIGMKKGRALIRDFYAIR